MANQTVENSGQPKSNPDATCPNYGSDDSIFVSLGINRLPDVEITGQSASSGNTMFWQHALGPLVELGSGDSSGGGSAPVPAIGKEARCRSEFEACLVAAKEGAIPKLMGDFCILATAKGGAKWGGWIGAMIGAGCAAGKEYYVQKATTECHGKLATCMSN